MAWFDDDSKTVHVAVYKNEKGTQSDVERAARRGWTVQGTSGIGGHVNVRRTAARVITAGFLVGGASRSKDKLTLTFVRGDAWHAKRARMDEAVRSAGATAFPSAHAISVPLWQATVRYLGGHPLFPDADGTLVPSRLEIRADGLA